jgi:DNA repair protein RadD
MLRDYQTRTIDQLYQWFEAGNTGNPCLVLPTGSGKSHIIAALCKDALQSWPETRILMLTHVKELIEQNAEKMRLHWPNAPMGIYSAGLRQKELGEPITFAGIQSVRTKAKQIGHVDLVIIDEAHLVSHKDEGGYRTLLAELSAINPNLRIVGLTASPYRLGHGYITDKPAIFDALIEPVSIEELIHKGFLSTLRSKLTRTKLEVDGVHKRGGEYIEAELQAAVDTSDKNRKVAAEIVRLGFERKSWLVFCAGVAHAQHIAEALQDEGITTECVTGETPSNERDRILTDFKQGRIRALTNANVLTTGFDAPGIDLVAMLRPTMSPGLYVQMAGRGLRIAPGKTDCLVLDFAGVVEQHGPITAVRAPPKKGDKVGEAPVKVCDHCQEICALSVRVCPACGKAFPEPERPALRLHNLDIMGQDGTDLEVTAWTWRKHISRASGREMLSVTYYGGLSDPPVTEYLAVTHDGYAGEKSRRLLADIAHKAGVVLDYAVVDLHQMAQQMTEGRPPSAIEFKREGRFLTVLKRTWKFNVGDKFHHAKYGDGVILNIQNGKGREIAEIEFPNFATSFKSFISLPVYFENH